MIITVRTAGFGDRGEDVLLCDYFDRCTKSAVVRRAKFSKKDGVISNPLPKGWTEVEMEDKKKKHFCCAKHLPWSGLVSIMKKRS